MEGLSRRCGMRLPPKSYRRLSVLGASGGCGPPRYQAPPPPAHPPLSPFKSQLMHTRTSLHSCYWVNLCGYWYACSPDISEADVQQLFLPTAEGLVALWTSAAAPLPRECSDTFARTALQGSVLSIIMQSFSKILFDTIAAPLKYFWDLRTFAGIPPFTTASLPSTCSLATVRLPGSACCFLVGVLQSVCR